MGRLITTCILHQHWAAFLFFLGFAFLFFAACFAWMIPRMDERTNTIKWYGTGSVGGLHDISYFRFPSCMSRRQLHFCISAWLGREQRSNKIEPMIPSCAEGGTRGEAANRPVMEEQGTQYIFPFCIFAIFPCTGRRTLLAFTQTHYSLESNIVDASRHSDGLIEWDGMERRGHIRLLGYLIYQFLGVFSCRNRKIRCEFRS